MQSHAWTVDDEWARIAREDVPGFAGYYIDLATHDGVVRFKNTPDAQNKLAAVAAALHLNDRDARQLKQWRAADYDFNELKGAADVIRSQIAGVKVTLLDIDERINRIVLGVLPGTARASVRAELARLRVPEAMVNIEEDRLVAQATPISMILCDTCPPPPDTSTITDTTATYNYIPTGPGSGLQDYWRPLVGGLQTEYLGSDGHIWGCAIGAVAHANVSLGSYMGILTASHCSAYGPGATDYTLFYQGALHGYTTPIAQKLLDPPWNRLGCPYGYANCRYSDAQFAQFQNGPSYAAPYIARTTFEDIADTNYARQVNQLEGFAITFQRQVPNAQLSPPSGTPVFKVGPYTGYTSGTVGRTCVDVGMTNLTEALCQGEMLGRYLDVPVCHQGDSGAAVVSYDALQQYTFEGLAIGKNPDANGCYFSLMVNIRYELGDVSVQTP